MSSSGPTVKVGLAGIGGFGDLYLEALLPRERELGAQIVGVVEPLPQRCRHLGDLRARGVPVHSTLPGLFAATDLDLMMIVTPIHLHAAQTCYALQRGANVLCEKPLAGTLADARRMQHVQRNSRGFAAIGFQWSYSQAVQALKRDVMDGVLGRARRLKSIVFFPRSRGYFRRNDWAGRIHTADGDGVLDSPVNNATSHYLHNMLYVLGPTRQSSAVPAVVQAELYRANDIENYDTAAIRCQSTCGAEILFYTTHATPQRLGPRLWYEFENATVEFDGAGTGQLIARFRDGRVKCYGQPNADRHEKIWQAIEAVRSGEPVACGIDAAMSHTLCVVAAQASARGTIGEFPQRLRRLIPYDGDALLTIDGLPEALLDAYDRAILPSERGNLDWARPGIPIDLAHPEWSARPEPSIAVHA